MRNRLLFVAGFLLLALVIQWLIGPLCETRPTSFSVDIKQLPRDGTMQLYYDIGKGYSENRSIRMQVQLSQLPTRVVCQLPADTKPLAISIALHDQQGDIEIGGMDFGYYHYSAADIKGSFIGNAHIGEMTVDGQVLRVRASGPDPYLNSMGSLDYIYGYLATRAVVTRAAAFVMTLFAFFTIIALLANRRRIDHEVALSICQTIVFYTLCLLLLIPFAYTILNRINAVSLPTFDTAETKPDFPKFTWDTPANFLNKSITYFDKAYAFRDLLIRWNGTFNIRVLDESPLATLISGKDGRIYVNMNGSLDDHIGLKRLSPKELGEINRQISGIKSYLDKKGIYLLVVFAPDMESIYPEFMPERYGPLVKNTSLDQVISELKTIPGLEYIDLRDTVRSAKEPYELFNKHDSHWNQLGGFYGYREIAQKLSTQFKQVPVPAIEDVKAEDYFHGVNANGLSRMLIMNGEFSDSYIELSTQPQNKEKIATPSLLIFRDSFYNRLAPFFQNYFQTVVAASSDTLFNTDLVEREQPDAVIIIRVERLCRYPFVRQPK